MRVAAVADGPPGRLDKANLCYLQTNASCTLGPVQIGFYLLLLVCSTWLLVLAGGDYGHLKAQVADVDAVLRLGSGGQRYKFRMVRPDENWVPPSWRRALRDESLELLSGPEYLSMVQELHDQRQHMHERERMTLGVRLTEPTSASTGGEGGVSDSDSGRQGGGAADITQVLPESVRDASIGDAMWQVLVPGEDATADAAATAAAAAAAASANEADAAQQRGP